MTALVADRAKETSTSTGVGNFTLLGAVAQFQSLNAARGVGVYFGYAIVGQSGTQWETGLGYLSGTTTLVRERPLDGSAGVGVPVDFSAGTKDVFISLVAEIVTSRGQIAAMAAGAAMQ